MFNWFKKKINEEHALKGKESLFSAIDRKQTGKFIPSEILHQFLRSYEMGDIWQVHELNSKCLIVFLFHDNQIDTNKGLPIYNQMKEDFFKLATTYLDDAPTSPDEIRIDFDSKEHFESTYNGNWHNYYNS